MVGVVGMVIWFTYTGSVHGLTLSSNRNESSNGEGAKFHTSNASVGMITRISEGTLQKNLWNGSGLKAVHSIAGMGKTRG